MSKLLKDFILLGILFSINIIMHSAQATKESEPQKEYIVKFLEHIQNKIQTNTAISRNNKADLTRLIYESIRKNDIETLKIVAPIVKILDDGWNTSFDQQGRNYVTLLYWALERNHFDLAHFFIQQGAPVSINFELIRALFEMNRPRAIKILNFLFDHNLQVDCNDRHAFLFLQNLITKNPEYIDLIEWLILAGTPTILFEQNAFATLPREASPRLHELKCIFDALLPIDQIPQNDIALDLVNQYNDFIMGYAQPFVDSMLRLISLSQNTDIFSSQLSDSSDDASRPVLLRMRAMLFSDENITQRNAVAQIFKPDCIKPLTRYITDRHEIMHATPERQAALHARRAQELRILLLLEKIKANTTQSFPLGLTREDLLYTNAAGQTGLDRIQHAAINCSRLYHEHLNREIESLMPTSTHQKNEKIIPKSKGK